MIKNNFLEKILMVKILVIMINHFNNYTIYFLKKNHYQYLIQDIIHNM